MLKKLIIFCLIILLSPLPLFAQEISEEAYVNQLNYRRNKLEIVTKKRVVDENRSYSSTNINTTVYSYEAYSQTYGNVATSSLSQREAKEYEDWYVYKGGVRELNDLELLQLVEDQAMFKKVEGMEAQRFWLRSIGNFCIGVGILTMIGGASLSAGQPVITGGALVTTSGFFLSAFNQSPHHYIPPDYAQEKIDDYNVSLKKNLNLPLDFE